MALWTAVQSSLSAFMILPEVASVSKYPISWRRTARRQQHAAPSFRPVKEGERPSMVWGMWVSRQSFHTIRPRRGFQAGVYTCGCGTGTTGGSAHLMQHGIQVAGPNACRLPGACVINV